MDRSICLLVGYRKREPQDDKGLEQNSDGNSAICKEAPPKRQFSTLHRRRLKAPVLRREIKFTYSLMGLQNSAVTTCADQVPGVVNSLQSGDIYVMRECRYLVDGINGLISVEELDPV